MKHEFILKKHQANIPFQQDPVKNASLKKKNPNF